MRLVLMCAALRFADHLVRAVLSRVRSDEDGRGVCVCVSNSSNSASFDPGADMTCQIYQRAPGRSRKKAKIQHVRP